MESKLSLNKGNLSVINIDISENKLCVYNAPCALVSNPCENQVGCSHFCLLSSTSTSRYHCSCPDGMTLSDDEQNCECELLNCFKIITHCSNLWAVSPFLLYTRATNNIHRLNLDHSMYNSTIYSGGIVRALDFDYRYFLAVQNCFDWLLISGEITCSGQT